MTKVTNLSQIVSAATNEASLRTLVLIDLKTMVSVYGAFIYPYDQNQSPEAVSQMFDAALFKLEMTHQPQYTVTDIPIVQYIGRWKVTIVIRNKDNTLVIRDGEQKSIDSYLGVSR